MQTTNQKGIVKLTKAQYNTLVTTGSVTDGSGQTFTYQDGYLYVTDDVEYVSFTEAQVLTPEQQAQARANIGAGSGSGGTEVYVNSVLQSTLSFDSDPQTQISAKVPNTRTIAGVDLQDNITKNELLTALNVEDGAEVNEVNDVEIDDVSCVTGTTAEIRTINGDYNASTNRLATASDISDKVDETNTANKVYGTDNSGNQTTYDVANASNIGNAVAKYDASGRLKTSTPSASDDATNKNYVDNVLSNPNLLINGDFRVNQRGQNSYTTNNKYTVDRWLNRTGCNVSVTSQNAGTPTLTSSGGSFNGIFQSLENTTIQTLLGKTVTLSIKLLNISVSSDAFVRLAISNATSASAVGTLLGYIDITTSGIHSVTTTLPSSLANSYLNISVGFPDVSVNTDTCQIEYVKLEVGETATQFSPRLYVEELAMCQRYYCRYNASTSYHVFSVGYIKQAGQAHTYFPFKVSMRTPPTITTSGSLIANYSQGNTGATTITNDQSSQDATNILLAFSNLNSQYIGQGIMLRANNDNSAYIEADAEIY